MGKSAIKVPGAGGGGPLREDNIPLIANLATLIRCRIYIVDSATGTLQWPAVLPLSHTYMSFFDSFLCQHVIRKEERESVLGEIAVFTKIMKTRLGRQLFAFVRGEQYFTANWGLPLLLLRNIF